MPWGRNNACWVWWPVRWPEWLEGREWEREKERGNIWIYICFYFPNLYKYSSTIKFNFLFKSFRLIPFYSKCKAACPGTLHWIMPLSTPGFYMSPSPHTTVPKRLQSSFAGVLVCHRDLFLFQYHIVYICIALQCILRSGGVKTFSYLHRYQTLAGSNFQLMKELKNHFIKIHVF